MPAGKGGGGASQASQRIAAGGCGGVRLTVAIRCLRACRRDSLATPGDSPWLGWTLLDPAELLLAAAAAATEVTAGGCARGQRGAGRCTGAPLWRHGERTRRPRRAASLRQDCERKAMHCNCQGPPRPRESIGKHGPFERSARLDWESEGFFAQAVLRPSGDNITTSQSLRTLQI